MYVTAELLRASPSSRVVGKLFDICVRQSSAPDCIKALLNRVCENCHSAYREQKCLLFAVTKGMDCDLSVDSNFPKHSSIAF